MTQVSKSPSPLLTLLLTTTVIVSTFLIFVLNQNKPIIVNYSTGNLQDANIPDVLAASTSAKIKTLTGPAGPGLTTATVITPKGNFKATILSLDNVRMLTDSASDSECSDNCPSKSLKDFVTANNGFAGVNGTYFCPNTYPECSTKKNTFDFPIYNSRLNKWMSQNSLGWDGRSLFYQDGSGFQYRQDSKNYPGSPTGAIMNYPGLVNDGNVQIDDNQSGLSAKQQAKGTKIGIGTKGGSNVLIVTAYNVNMQQFAYVFKTLGATGALNLDTGGSAAVYLNGRYILGPGRAIPNAVVFAR